MADLILPHPADELLSWFRKMAARERGELAWLALHSTPGTGVGRTLKDIGEQDYEALFIAWIEGAKELTTANSIGRLVATIAVIDFCVVRPRADPKFWKQFSETNAIAKEIFTERGAHADDFALLASVEREAELREKRWRGYADQWTLLMQTTFSYKGLKDWELFAGAITIGETNGDFNDTATPFF